MEHVELGGDRSQVCRGQEVSRHRSASPLRIARGIHTNATRKFWCCAIRDFAQKGAATNQPRATLWVRGHPPKRPGPERAKHRLCRPFRACVSLNNRFDPRTLPWADMSLPLRGVQTAQHQNAQARGLDGRERSLRHGNVSASVFALDRFGRLRMTGVSERRTSRLPHVLVGCSSV